MHEGKCHDLKTERREVLRGGLPASYQLVPIGFYASMVLCSLLAVWFYLGLKNAETREREAAAAETQFSQQTAQLNVEIKEMEILADKAKATSEWVEGSQGLQPLVVGISRSMGNRSTIAEMSLTRNTEMPAQIFLDLKMDDITPAVREAVQDSIRDLKFRAHNQDEKWPEDTSLDYVVTLVWKGNR